MKTGIKHKNYYKVKQKQAGLAPGTLIYTGNKSGQKVNISLIKYQGDYFEENKSIKIEKIPEVSLNNFMMWLNIDGIHQIELIENIGNHFNLHPLILEDILHPSQLTKVEEYDDQIFMIMRLLNYDPVKKEIIKNDQVSIVLGSNYLISFQEEESDFFEPVTDRLRKGGPKMRNGKMDYLAYALIDAIVDSYFLILEKIEVDIEEIEDKLLSKPEKEQMEQIHQLKRVLLSLRKTVIPLKEMFSAILRNETGKIQHSTKIFIRDASDHATQLMDTIDSYRDMVMNMQDLYLSSMSNKMNEVMKTLTIIATIFIPLTFLAGVYGMNFKYLPELGWKWMYPYGFWGTSLLIILIILWFSKKKKWI